MIDSTHRIDGIDVAKGIGILLIVIGHLSGTYGTHPKLLGDFQNLLYQFHVPLFFFLSGLFFRETEGWGIFLKKKIKHLYIPFVVANLVFLILDELLRFGAGIRIVPVDEIKHGIKVVLMISNCPMGGATWFLRSLLLCSIIYKAIYTLVRNRRPAAFMLCLAFSVCGMWAPSAYSFSATLLAMVFYCTGHILSGKIFSVFDFPLWLRLLVFSVCSLLLFLTSHNNHFDCALGIYENHLLAIPMAFVGTACIITLSSFCRKSAVYDIFKSIGKETICILIGHFAAFKLVVAFQILLLGLPFKAMLSHPCYDVSGYWWMLYWIIGIILPIFVYKCVKKNKFLIG